MSSQVPSSPQRCVSVQPGAHSASQPSGPQSLPVHCGTQMQAPSRSQTSLAAHPGPHSPPHPSGPHSFPAHKGMHGQTTHPEWSSLHPHSQFSMVSPTWPHESAQKKMPAAQTLNVSGRHCSRGAVSQAPTRTVNSRSDFTGERRSKSLRCCPVATEHSSTPRSLRFSDSCGLKTSIIVLSLHRDLT